ncbi:hypothetical protein GCM10027440_36650 [Nocardiopsis coralliicola]
MNPVCTVAHGAGGANARLNAPVFHRKGVTHSSQKQIVGRVVRGVSPVQRGRVRCRAAAAERRAMAQERGSGAQPGLRSRARPAGPGPPGGRAREVTSVAKGVQGLRERTRRRPGAARIAGGSL